MIIVNLDVMMARRKIGLAELAEKVGISPANLSILKNNKCKAIRFSTLDALCQALFAANHPTFWRLRRFPMNKENKPVKPWFLPQSWPFWAQFCSTTAFSSMRRLGQMSLCFLCCFMRRFCCFWRTM